MRSIVRGVVALFAAFCIMDVANAAPTIVSPADYSKVSPFSLAFKNIIEDGSLGPDGKFATKDGKIIWSNPYFGYSDYYKYVNGVKETNPDSQRVADRILSHENSLPVTLKWGNSSGTCTVKLWRTKKDTESTPQFTVTTTENSVKFYDLEIGRNYTWTVTDSTGKATGHFYVMNESQAPRILLYDHDPNASGSDTSNTRDIGGYRTYKGSKVIKQGLIYRTAELEWCNPVDAAGICQELTYLKNTIGIKCDIDFRDHADMTSTAELGYAGSSSKWKWAWKNGSYLNLNESNIGAGIPRLNINKLTGTQFGSYTGLVPKKSGTTTANKNNRKNVWCAFTNVADSAKWPLVFHCSHGKDRAGTFALVLHGVLDIPKEIALKDFAISWFDSPDETLNSVNMANTITNLFSYTSYSSNNEADYRFKEQCYNFLVQCGKDAGVTEANAKSKIDSFVSAMTEDAEEPDVNPALSTNRETDGDTFSYTTIYHRRDGGGGSLGSDNGSTLNYIYSSSTTTSTHAPKGNLNTYNTCLCFWPVDGLPYSSPVCGYNKVGKIVTYGRYAPAGVGPYNFKAYFSSEGHSVTDRTIIEHRSGVGNYENVDFYFTTYDSSNLGEGNKNASYVYKGSSAAIEVWANATMRVRDIRDMSQKRTTKGYKAYLKFPKGSCDNARFEALEIDGDGENLLGWFTGGEVGTRQYVKVVNSILQFNAPSKTSGVEGALGLEFSLGGVNTTSSAAMLNVAGTLNINAGSTIAVDAGRKGAGTYKLVSAGTLNDNANLVFYSTVENCAEGYYGLVVRDGNNLNLVIQEGEPPDTNAEDIADADEGDWGYRVRGLGALKNETAIVFTNTAKAANWVVPSNLENVQFLVVGGGGGGGADTHASNTHGGAGGGGGGVVTGLVNFAENSVITVSVGAGGNGGITATKGGSNNNYGAAYSGKASYVFVDGSEYFWTAGGGGDNGADTSTNTTLTKGNVGNDGGSSAGSRPGQTGRGAVVASRVASVSNVKYADTSFGRQGGAGYSGTETFYNYYSAAGGGGGATTEGETASSAKAAGKGGEGLTSDITGTSRVYGSGGGGGAVAGGCGALGGTGAGCGNMADVTVDNYATYLNAVANQGGGGGGAARGIPGGNGGSGIVVLRYVDPTSAPVDPENPDIKLIAEPAVIPNLVFNGNEQNGVITGEGYTLSGVTKAEAAGTYEAIATLKTGYKWLDGTTEPKTITWSIAKFTNIWTIEPSISLSSWITGATPGELNMGVAKFGTVIATMNGAAFTELPTAVGTYSIVCTVEATSNYTALSETITFEILEVPVINPTEYGTADSAASTYTWIGYTGPWMYTTNWTATAAGTYGVPDNGTYATADFPATLANAFTCTLNESVSVNKAEFNSPNMTFVLDNALLTLKGKVDSYAACDFGDGENDNSTIELRGANAGIVSASNEVRLNFGYRHGDVTPTGTVTVRFVVPETGWESDARIKATGGDSKVVFYQNSKLEIDATALGVPAEGTTMTVYLASGTGDNGVYVSSSATNIVCAAGAKGSIKIENKKLVLTVEADETTEPDEPQEPQLTAVDAPVAQTGLVYTGSELTGVESVAGYTLTGNTATDAGEYTAIATLAEGYKWSDDTTEPKTITWSIAKATNEWTTEPKISLESWTQGEAAGVLTSGVAKFGTVTASMTELPTEVGSYTITYTVAETKNYTGLNATVQFEIKAPEVVEPEEPGDDPVSQIPTIPAEWGYVKTDLGDLHNEVAVVFTNHIDKAMSWTVPADIENVQFLVVGGGGGGGGAVNSTKGGAGGAGGGGGCVVTGIVNKLEENTVITVGVGGGGNGGLYDTSSGSAYHGTNSYFKVGDVTYVTAYGGAGDLGFNNNSGVNNGSNSGSRYDNTTASAAVGTAATWDQTTLSDKLSNVATFRRKGGNNSAPKSYSSGGGGGATEDGKAPGSSSYGGHGGKGLTSSITGVEKMYGSGGSGATAKNGGYEIPAPEGAGSSYAVKDATNHGGDGADNQGGGGGGGGYQGNGGKGGSGIVVFRYTLKSEVKVNAAEYIESKLTDKVYTGSLLMSGLTEDEAYTVSEVGGVNVGEYTVTVTLKSGFVWADGNTSSTSNFTWKITKHENKWSTDPLLSVKSWAQGYAPNVKFVAPVQTVGELNATITTNGVTEAFSGTLPTDPGEYTINYSVAETENYAGRTWSASFKIYRSEPINGGYKVFGLGAKGNEEAMVFTQSGIWTLDKSLNNVQFLVVGGGGGGGADASATEDSPLQGGAGGGGGGVVTGLVNFVNGQTVAITVGTGGLGGIAGDNTSGKYGAAQSQAADSSFGIGNVTYVTAVAGGGDSGSTSKSYNADLAGSNGGSGSGGRPNMAGGNADTENINLTYIVCGDKLGNKGGSGCTTAWDGYGYAAAGGGGGAVHSGQPGYVDSTTGNYNGGNGGEGYLSDITGTELVYGSGGGGGTVKSGSVGGKGGTGAGDGVVGGNATSAVPNQGGGGGGGGRAGNGGNGGSGIVVFRYVVLKSPMIGDSPVDAAEAFEIAKVSKPVLYPSEPEVSTNTVDGVKVVTVSFGGVNAPVPDCYDVIKSVTDKGYQISLVIKDEFKNPTIADSADDETPAIKVENGKVKIHLEGTHEKLHYSLMTSTSLESNEPWSPIYSDPKDNSNFTFGDGDKKLDDIRFFKVGEVSDEPIE